MAVWEKILYELKLKKKIDRQLHDDLLKSGIESGISKLVEKGAIASADEAYSHYFYAIKSHSLDDILISERYITPDDLEKLTLEFGGTPGNLKDILIERGIATPMQVYKAIAIKHRVDFIDLTQTPSPLDDALIAEFDINVIRRYQFIPYRRENEKLAIIIDDPSDVDRIEEIESVVGEPTTPCVAVKNDITRNINLLIDSSLSENALFGDRDEAVNLKNLQEEDADEKASEPEFIKTLSDINIVGTVNSIILKAVRKKASDIHFEVYPDELKVKFRIDGSLVTVRSIEARLKNFIVSRIKNMANLDISEKRIPQDGRIKLFIDDRAIDFRVSVLPSIFGETVVIRVLDQNALGLDLSNLGFPEADLLKFKKNILKPYGMILVAGPTGSGKTTTLYSAIKFIKTPEDKIITVEDPVEYQIPDIVQVNVNEKKGLSFASGLRSIVRQDPDKVMVGEIRDFETADIAINAALTGHLVLSTIHANNVVDAVGRLISMGVDPYQFVSSFNLILSQRLIRKICLNCREEHQADPESLSLIDDFERHAAGAKLYKGKGCRYCHNTGYSGRIGIYETMPLSEHIKSMILKKTSPIEITRQAIAEGMQTLRAAAWKKVVEGVTTIEEINQVTLQD